MGNCLSCKAAREEEEEPNPAYQSEPLLIPREIVVPADAKDEGSKYWKQQVVSPSSHDDAGGDQAPAAAGDNIHLTLEHVYGYSGHDTRQSAHFTPSGEVVFVAATLGVVMDPATGRQRFYRGHDDDVTCVAVDPKHGLVATGQGHRLGRDSTPVHLWDSTSMERKSLLGGHARGVGALAFSESGATLVSVGLDADHRVIVYRITRPPRTPASRAPASRLSAPSAKGLSVKRMAEARGGPKKVFSAAFVLSDATFATCSQAGMCVWQGSRPPHKSGITARPVIFGAAGAEATILVAAGHSGGCTLAGTSHGYIYRFAPNRKLDRGIWAHSGAVHALATSATFVVSGGKDGCVNILDGDLNQCKAFSLGVCVRSVAISGDKVLAGTQGGAIYMFFTRGTLSEVVTLVDGHGPLHEIKARYDGQMWGLAAHPAGRRLATSDDSGVVKFWDPEARRCLDPEIKEDEGGQGEGGAVPGGVVLPGRASLAWSLDGILLAAGLLGGAGVWVCEVEPGPWRVLAKISTAGGEGAGVDVGAVSFSPNPEGAHLLAAGCSDGVVRVFSSRDREGWALHRELAGARGPVTHLDWSADGRHLQVNTGAGGYQLWFWDVEGGKAVPAEAARDLQWNTFTCRLGWPTQGLYPSGKVEGEETGSVCRLLDAGLPHPILAAGDEFGRLKVWPYPALSSAAHHSTSKAHADRVAAVAALKGQACPWVFTVGASDLVMCQWRVGQRPQPEEEAIRPAAETKGRDSRATSPPPSTQGAKKAGGAKPSPRRSPKHPPLKAPSPGASVGGGRAAAGASRNSTSPPAAGTYTAKKSMPPNARLYAREGAAGKGSGAGKVTKGSGNGGGPRPAARHL